MVRKVNPYNDKIIESAKRKAIEEAGGIRNIVSDCVAATQYAPNRSLTDIFKAGCMRYAKETIMVYTSDRRAWLERRNVKLMSSVDSTFNAIFSTACYQICLEYMRKHNLVIASMKNKYGTTNFKLVKA